MKIDKKRAILEFASIVVAVVLAMSLTELRQNYLNKKLAERSFENIITEIKENRKELVRDSAKIKMDLDFMSKWIDDVKNDKTPEDFSVNFSFSFLSKSALEVAKVNQSLTFISNKRNMDIAEVYATQAFYTDLGVKVFDTMGEMVGIMSSQDLKGTIPAVASLRFRLSLVYNTVRAYLGESGDFLRDYATPASD